MKFYNIISKLIILILIFFYVNTTSAHAYSSNYIEIVRKQNVQKQLSDGDVICVDNKDDFYYALPYAITFDCPLLILGENNDAANKFVESYKGRNKQVNRDWILAHINDLPNKHTIIISDKENDKLSMIGSHIASIFKCPFIFVNDLELVLEKYSFDEAIVLGNHDIDKNNVIKITKLNDLKSINEYYNKITFGHTLNVYNYEEDTGVISAYLAARRNGRIIFSLDSLEKKDNYFAWVLKPESFSNSYYTDLYKLLSDSKLQKSTKGIGIITGKTLQDANLLLLRSFFYEHLDISHKVLNIEVLSQRENIRHVKDDYMYLSMGGEACTIKNINEEITDAAYVSVFAHGSPSGFLIANNINYTSYEMPYMKPIVFVAESCHTIGFYKNNSIALEAIHKGAVAYIGSFKTGGVNSILLEGSYLFSSSEIPLSKLVLINNGDMLNTIESEPRAVLIGDPTFGMYKTIGNWPGKYEYNYNLMYDFAGRDTLIPILINGSKIKGCMISRGMKKVYPKIQILKNNNDNIAFITVNSPYGKIEFTKNVSIISKLKIFKDYFIDTINILVNQVLSIELLNIFTILICLALYWNISRNQEKKVLTLGIAGTFLSAFIVCIIEIILLGAKLSFYKVLSYSCLFLLVNNIKSIKKRFITLEIIIFVPVMILLYSIFSNINIVRFFTIPLFSYSLLFMFCNWQVKKCIGLIFKRKALFQMNVNGKKSGLH